MTKGPPFDVRTLKKITSIAHTFQNECDRSEILTVSVLKLLFKSRFLKGESVQRLEKIKRAARVDYID